MDSASITMEEYKDTAEVFKKSFEKAGKKFEKERKKAVRNRQGGPIGKEWGRKVEAPKQLRTGRSLKRRVGRRPAGVWRRTLWRWCGRRRACANPPNRRLK